MRRLDSLALVAITTLALSSGCNDLVLESSTLGGIDDTTGSGGGSSGVTAIAETTASTVDPDASVGPTDDDDSDPTLADTTSEATGDDASGSTGGSSGGGSSTDASTSSGDPTDEGSTGATTTTDATTTDATTTDATTTDATTTDATTTDATTTDATTTDATTTDAITSAVESSSDGGSTSDGGSSSSGDGGNDSGGEPTIGLPYDESFALADGAAWPAPWTISNAAVSLADIDGGMGRLLGETGTTARMVNTGVSALDFDAVFTVRFESWLTQGAGFYVRQNGGTLDDTVPPGQGYAVFVEGGFMGLIGIWREVDGVEELIEAAPVPAPIVDGASYRIRLQCTQEGAHTVLRTRLWPIGEVEPVGWDVDTTDASPELQNVQGGLGADVYEYEGVPAVWFDDIHVDGS